MYPYPAPAPDDDDDDDNDIAEIEDEIERLADIAERCRKFIFGAKVAMTCGGLTLAAIVLGVLAADPVLLVAALAAVLGGIVVLGSNVSTRRQSLAAIASAQARRAALIDRLDLRLLCEQHH